MRAGTFLLAATLLTGAGIAKAAPGTETILPSAVTFATSTGYWEESKADIAIERTPETSGKPVSADQAAAKPGESRHGYYKLFSVRQDDRTSKVYLQQVAQTDGGPQIVSTVELHEFTDLKPYVTDIRPENSTGIIKQPGLFATVYLKTDPDAEPDGWTVLIDEFGEISVEKATN
ncbi:hypothetical protein [Rhizobium sp. BE258]|jgi:hypothetical protein|uniref:hypothetical protein n=1 Tax=Rhizobium sp. BE258 TaxID=2817722 RepID=UPI000DD674CE|nr:hypothetical protein [Rhizobium sp. BE258]